MRAGEEFLRPTAKTTLTDVQYGEHPYAEVSAVRVATCVALLVALAAAPAFGQPDEAPVPEGEARGIVPAPEEEGEADIEVGEMLEQMGAPPQVAMLLKLLGQQDMDPMMMLMLMRMMGGNVDDDLMGMLFFSKLLQAGTSRPAQPTTVLKDDMLLIVEDGVVYKIDVANMSLAGTVIYKQKAAQANPLATLLPLMMLGRPRAEAQAIPMGEAIEEFEEGAVEVEPPRPVP